MHIEDFFKRLSWGVLQNLKVGLDGSGGIQNKDYPRVFLYTNEALLELFTLFNLKQNTMKILMLPNKDFYLISVDNTFANYYNKYGSYPEKPLTPSSPFIFDNIENPYRDDLIKVLSVYTDSGENLPIDDLNAPESIFIPRLNTLQVPEHFKHKVLSIEYQAKHPRLTLINTGDDEHFSVDGSLEIPEVLLEALECLVAHKVFSHMGGVDNFHRANTMYSLYQASVSKLLSVDMVNPSQSFTSSLFEERGWI